MMSIISADVDETVSTIRSTVHRPEVAEMNSSRPTFWSMNGCQSLPDTTWSVISILAPALYSTISGISDLSALPDVADSTAALISSVQSLPETVLFVMSIFGPALYSSPVTEMTLMPSTFVMSMLSPPERVPDTPDATALAISFVQSRPEITSSVMFMFGPA